ncbi:MAG: 3-oxoacyl-[acyl-carrier-protein] synthase III C-terminal domain-containing protein [Chlamydiales bacterium]
MAASTILGMDVYLFDFHVIRPAHLISQEEILEWIALSHAQAEAAKNREPFDQKFHEEIRSRLLKLGVGKEKIQSRGIQLPEIFEKEHQKRNIYNFLEKPYGQTLTERATVFSNSIRPLFEKFYPEKCKAPSHLIHITCTGYVSPSGAQEIVSKRGMGKSTVVTHAYHMGCYAAIPGLRIASGFLSKSGTRVDLVHTEFCSLHMNPLLHETEQLVVQSLFADGFIKYTLSGQNGIFKILQLQEEILEATTEQMTWRTEEWGFRMFISKEVPFLISRVLPEFVERLKASPSALFAIHPGGPKIIEQVKKSLKLSDEQIHHSQMILRTCGNMSSATLPHIWEEIGKDRKVKVGTEIVSLAFGPGLTVCAAHLEKTGHV